MNLNKKGYMLVEIIVAFALTFSIAMYLLNLTLKFKDTNENIYYSTKYIKDKNLITRNIMEDLSKGFVSDIDTSNIGDKTLSFYLTFINDSGTKVKEKRALMVKDQTIYYGKYESSFVTTDYSYYKKKLNSSLIIGDLENCSDDKNFCVKLKITSMYDDKNYDINLYTPIDSNSAILSEKTYVLTTGKNFNSLIPSDATAIEFTYDNMPSESTLIDVDEDGDGGVVAWLDGTTMKISTQKSTQKIIANSSSNEMFMGEDSNVCMYLTSISGLEKIDTSQVSDAGRMFEKAGYYSTSFVIDGLNSWNTSKISDMNRMFSNTGYKSKTFNIDLSEWDTSNVASMYFMFSKTGYNATTFNLGNLNNWQPGHLVYNMFEYAGYKATTSFNIGDLSSWNTSGITNMNFMFYRTGYEATWSLDCSSWDVSSVISHVSFNYGITTKVIAPTW